jgi:DNA-binding transcriptional MerR regulator
MSTLMAPSEYRIDDLARQAGTTVRNVRAYQDRRLLTRPRIEGRVALYNDGHLARLKLIGQMLQRGFSLAQIEELLSAVAQGRDLAEVLGLEAQVLTAWSDEVELLLTQRELEERIGVPLSQRQLARAKAAGLVDRRGGKYSVRSPKLLAVAAELIAAGISLDTVLDLAASVGDATDTIAQFILDAMVPALFPELKTGHLPGGDQLNARVALVQRLRPLAQTAVDAYLAGSMEKHVNDVLVTLLESSEAGAVRATAS